MSDEQKPAEHPSDSDEAADLNLHAWLDGELDPEGLRAFEDRLRSDPVLRHKVEMLQGMESWMREEISPAPQNLVVRVAREIEGQPRTRARGWWNGLWVGLRANRRQIWQVWTPAVGVLAVILILLFRSGPGGRPTPEPPSSPGTQARATLLEFRFEASNAQTVCLVGDFNHWKVCDTPLTRVGGIWRTEVELPPGRHEYMFVVDGAWVTDPRASQYADDGFGNRNALVFL